MTVKRSVSGGAFGRSYGIDRGMESNMILCWNLSPGKGFPTGKHEIYIVQSQIYRAISKMVKRRGRLMPINLLLGVFLSYVRTCFLEFSYSWGGRL